MMEIVVDSVIDKYLSQSVESSRTLLNASPVLVRMSALIKRTIQAQGTVFTCGNGGSFAMAQHFAAEISVRFESSRPGFRAIALGSDGVALTALSNDFGFDQIFARSISTFARPGDLLLAFSTSGKSRNVLCALETARDLGLSRLGFTGDNETSFPSLCDVTFVASSHRTAFIQEAHLIALHAICAKLDHDL